MQGYALAYSFICFSLGIACLSLLLVTARRRGDVLARAFLVFYTAITVMVLGALLRTFIEVHHPPVSATQLIAVEYFEAIVGRYGVLFGLPFFVHRLFGVASARRDIVTAAVVMTALAIQHVTEYALGGVWDDRGDLFEDLLSAGFIAYVLVIAFTHLRDSRVVQPLANRFVAMLVVGLPGISYDIFLGGDTIYRFYPLWYCTGSLVLTATLLQRRWPEAAVPDAWGLSKREAEVARLVQLGRSNKEIADELQVSPNTVKTHLTAIFDKSGLRSRFELIAAARHAARDDIGPETR